MMLWDLGTFDVLEGMPADQQIARGDFKFRLHGHKLKGDFALVRMKNSQKGNEWLLLKKKDAAAPPLAAGGGFAARRKNKSQPAREIVALDGLSLDVRAGEIFGRT